MNHLVFEARCCSDRRFDVSSLLQLVSSYLEKRKRETRRKIIYIAPVFFFFCLVNEKPNAKIIRGGDTVKGERERIQRENEREKKKKKRYISLTDMGVSGYSPFKREKE